MAVTKYLKLVSGSYSQAATTDDISVGSLTLNTVGTSLTLAASVNASIGGTLAVTGTTTLTGALTLNGGGTLTSGQTLTATGATIACGGGATVSGTVTASGAWSFTLGAGTGVAVTANATVGGTLGVTGAATLGSIVSTAMDTATNVTMSIGGTQATTITIGRSGQQVNFPGNIQVTGTETIVGGTTFSSNMNFGPTGTASGGTPTYASILAQWQYSWWNGSVAATVSGYALKVTPSSTAAGVGDLQFLDAGTTERFRMVAGANTFMLGSAGGTLSTIAAGALTIGGNINAVTITPASTHTGLGTFNGGATVASGQTLTVTGATVACGGGATLTGTLNTNGSTIGAGANTTVTGQLTTQGATLACGTGMTVTGTVTVQGATLAFGTGGTISGGTVTASGAWSFTYAGTAITLGASSNASFGGTLGVTGVTTLGQANITTAGAATAIATPDLEATGYGGIGASAGATLSIGTDSGKTGPISIGRSGQTTTIQGNLTVNGTLGGSVANAAAVAVSGFTADAAGVTANYAIYISIADKVLHAIATSLAAGSAVGFANVTASSGQAVSAITQGVIVTPPKQTGDPAWTPGNPIFLSATEAGKVTQTAPSTAGQIVMRVGFAKNTTDLLINIGAPVTL